MYLFVIPSTLKTHSVFGVTIREPIIVPFEMQLCILEGEGKSFPRLHPSRKKSVLRTCWNSRLIPGLDPFRAASSFLPFSVTIVRGTWPNIYIADPWHSLPPPEQANKITLGRKMTDWQSLRIECDFRLPRVLLGKLPFHLAALRFFPAHV